jgi:hypothetical protein
MPAINPITAPTGPVMKMPIKGAWLAGGAKKRGLRKPARKLGKPTMTAPAMPYASDVPQPTVWSPRISSNETQDQPPLTSASCAADFNIEVVMWKLFTPVSGWLQRLVRCFGMDTQCYVATGGVKRNWMPKNKKTPIEIYRAISSSKALRRRTGSVSRLINRCMFGRSDMCQTNETGNPRDLSMAFAQYQRTLPTIHAVIRIAHCVG